MSDKNVTIVEVGPRDGFQPIEQLIPTAQKIALIDSLYAAGIRRMEATAFVSEKAVPQLVDAPEILAHASSKPDLDVQVLVPSIRQSERALAAGAEHLSFVLSASEKHNMNNVRRTPADSVEDFHTIMTLMPNSSRIRLNLATSFDCPFDGPIPVEQTLALLQKLVPLAPDAEFCLCDTTGRVTPDRVSDLFRRATEQFPQVQKWAFHGHDTYGLGVANCLAAMSAGVRVMDSSFAGLGGCPFAPGATGNVSTEDLVWTLGEMGFASGIDLGGLIAAAMQGAAIPGGSVGGRVRQALTAAKNKQTGAQS